MKKKFAFMISVLLVCTCVLGLTACSSGGNGEHKHEYENEWSFDKNEHWQICKTCGGKGNVGKHSFIDGACKCGYAKGSENLSYKISVDDNYYIVTGMGTCNEKNISILSTYNGKPVREIEEKAFEGNTSIESVFIPNGVRKIGEKTFAGCSSLSSITIPNSVTDIEKNAFSNCALTNIVIPNNITRIKEGVFSGCSSLSSVTIPSSVNTIEMDAFSNCQNGRDVYYAGSVENWCKIKCYINSSPLSNGAKLYINGELVTNLVIPDGVTGIGISAFMGCGSIRSVTIPDSVTSIGEFAFYGCTSLTSVTIPNSVTSIGSHAFANCYRLMEIYNLSSLNIQKGSGENGGVAKYAKVVHTSKNEPSHITTTNDGYIFYDDENETLLVNYIGKETNIVLPSNFNGKTYQIHDNAFNYCGNITSVIIPKGVTRIGNSAFESCSSLTSIIIPNSITWIGISVFSSCSSLTSVTIPDSVTYIGYWAFRGCSVLEKIEVEKGNTKYHSDGNCIIETASKTLVLGCNNSVIPTDGSVTIIGQLAFNGCNSLTSITIPDSVTNIGYFAFDGCNALSEVFYKGTSSEWNRINIYEYNSNLLSATRYYYRETEPTDSGNYWHYVDGVVTKW